MRDDDAILEKDIQAIREWAQEEPIIHSVWIFGSRVRGTHQLESDLDVAVQHGVLSGDENAYVTGLHEHKKWQRQLQELTTLTIHLRTYEPGSTRPIDQAIREYSRLTQIHGF